MTNEAFARPVYVRRTHYVQEITGLVDALDLLEELPSASRNLAFEITQKACRNALSQRFPTHAAEETFRRFAQKAGILYEEDVVEPADESCQFKRYPGANSAQ